MSSIAAVEKRPTSSAPPNRPLVIPEELASERWIAAGVFLASCAYLCLFVRYTLLDPDEGIILQGAQRILHGQVLYRDFFSFYTPGSYYFLAVIFWIFGDSFFVARATLVAYGGIFAVFAYWMARRTCSRNRSLLIAYLAIVTCLPWRFMVLHNWDSTLWLCASIYCAVQFVRSPSRFLAFGIGSLACITFLFEQSKGAGLFCGLVLGFVILRCIQRTAPWCKRRYGIAFAAGLLLPMGLTLAYFSGQHSLSALWSDWLWPLHHYSAVNKVPYGYSDWSDQARRTLFGSNNRIETLIALFTVSPCFILPVLPILGLLLLVYWTVFAQRERLSPDRSAYYVLVSSSIAGSLVSVMAVRANIIHFVYLTPLLYLVFAWIIDGTDINASIVRSIRPALAMGIFVVFTATGMALLISNRNARSVVETRRGVIRTADPDQMFPYLQDHVAAGENIFVYPYFPLGYYLTATFNPTRYEYLQPGMHTHDQDLQAMKEVEADHTAAVLFEPSFYDKISTSWPNTPLSSLASDPVADYILSHYHPCANLVSGAGSRFLFMLRDGATCPIDPQGAGRSPEVSRLSRVSVSHNE
jgi:hypothetical protein